MQMLQGGSMHQNKWHQEHSEDVAPWAKTELCCSTRGASERKPQILCYGEQTQEALHSAHVSTGTGDAQSQTMPSPSTPTRQTCVPHTLPPSHGVWGMNMGGNRTERRERRSRSPLGALQKKSQPWGHSARAHAMLPGCYTTSTW